MVFQFVHVGVVQAAWERVGCITEESAFVQDFYALLVCCVRSNVSVYSPEKFVRSKLCKGKIHPHTLTLLDTSLKAYVFPCVFFVNILQ